MKKYLMRLDTLSAALSAFCDKMRDCDDCPFTGRKIRGESCDDYCNAHPEEAAELMGLEVVEVEEPKPRLAEQELAICKALGAKWVSKNEVCTSNVVFWKNKPKAYCQLAGKTSKRFFEAPDSEYIGSVSAEYFPSLNPGDLVNVEEILKEAEP